MEGECPSKSPTVACFSGEVCSHLDAPVWGQHCLVRLNPLVCFGLFVFSELFHIHYFLVLLSSPDTFCEGKSPISSDLGQMQGQQAQILLCKDLS